MRAVNLLPREPKRTRPRLGLAGQLAIVSPLVVGGLLAAGYLLTSSKAKDDRATLQALQAELATLPKPAPQPQQANPELAVQRDQRVAALSAVLQGRLAWDRILRELSAVLPGDVWLTSLSAQAPAPAPPPVPATTSTTTTSTATTTTAAVPAPTASPLTLAGYTYSQEGVARLLTRLAVVPALQDVKLIQSAQTVVNGRAVYGFSIQANVRPQETG